MHRKKWGHDSKRLNGLKKQPHLYCLQSKVTTIGNEWEIQKHSTQQ